MDRQERTAEAFSPRHQQRLAAVKAVVDPSNRFGHGFAV